MLQPITTINSIEVSSICDNACEYCPASVQHEHRPVGFMDMDTFKKALEWVKHFVEKETQKELNLFGVGEPTLNPEIVEMVRLARQVMPMRLPVHFNTNGNTMTKELAVSLREAGISHIDITGHNPRSAAKCIRIFMEVGIQGQLSIDPITHPNNWAGQVDWFESRDVYPCPWLHIGQAMIMSNGDVTTCCIDAFSKNKYATIYDDLSSKTMDASELCKTCHQTIPEHMKSGLILATR